MSGRWVWGLGRRPARGGALTGVHLARERVGRVVRRPALLLQLVNELVVAVLLRLEEQRPEAVVLVARRAAAACGGVLRVGRLRAEGGRTQGWCGARVWLQ